MKKLYLGIFMLLTGAWASAQINSVTNFDGSTTMPTGWTQTGASSSVTSINTCSGNSVRANLWGSAAASTLVSPNFTNTNGEAINVSFDYKVINFTGASTPPGTATPAGWGSITVQYSTDDGASWNNILVINDSNHVVSTSCANKSISLTAGTIAAGSSFKIRFNNARTAGDWYVYFDNIKIEQGFTALTVDWGNLQWPASGTITMGGNYEVYGQVYKAGVTEPAGAGAGINAWVGYSTTNTDPSTWTNWIPATFNVNVGNNDEYMANLGTSITAPGTYYYAMRYNYSGGVYYYGGYNAGGGGAWDGTNNVSGVLTVNAPVGFACSNPIQVTTLPYTTTDDTANYGDLIDGTPGATGCGSSSSYLNGNDVFYAYTPTSDGQINIKMTPTATWSGIFVYNSCASVGTACIAGVANSGSTVRNINNLAVTAGTTYYIVISTFPAPQTTGYQLEISQVTLATDNTQVISNIQLYPNPTKDVLNVKGMNPASVQVYSMDGKMIPLSVDGNVINTKNLPAGSYVIQLTDKEGNITSRRFVKK
ncbi:T9SS type A sorting domain-containing protein [Chryseobacterium suipulveris]|uniref:T9SS type A sorting domain-containing protein n=1 Tax=Chryseobacterium suipulveris TaxID=2929800 RepID=A0ABY4BRW6_9FLAO|nr:T9SS type A sorting domain-containing protein [Chryseobacterium suipulveris]UOE41943.1 T9SS type A sorting domain-containing protein [Chryseobacterium suipulveris]